ncbi:unnamed protein product [Meganyctiphanes norvegica]|uniref:Uncharacterized protein n=1 Tax=Meganyctiphanes norvegica TaxID=48144 RepID=A0AAV2QWT0_MEGNR
MLRHISVSINKKRKKKKKKKSLLSWKSRQLSKERWCIVSFILTIKSEADLNGEKKYGFSSCSRHIIHTTQISASEQQWFLIKTRIPMLYCGSADNSRCISSSFIHCINLTGLI